MGTEPVQNAVVEIWEADANGVYLHTRDTPRETRCKFPGLWPFSDRIHRRVLLPDHQTDGLPRAHAAHPFRGEDAWTREMDHAVLCAKVNPETSGISFTGRLRIARPGKR